MQIISLPKLHKAQQDALKKFKRFSVLACGRRWGKTRLASLIALKGLVVGGQWFWIAPSYPIAEVGWRLLKSLAIQIQGIQIAEADRRITFGNGWVQVRSSESKGGLRGEGLDGLIVDECAHIQGFRDIWEQELRPSLTDKKGSGLFISTPHGLNEFHDLYKLAESSDDWAAMQYSSNTNPFLDPEEIEAARLDMPQLVFRQEYMAEFVQLAGAMFRREYFEIVDTVPALSKQSRHWDLAASVKTQADRSAGVKIGLADDGTIYILDCIVGRWEWPGLVKIIGQTARADSQDVLQSVETGGTQKGMLDILNAESSLVGAGFRGIQPQADKVTRANPWLARAEQGKVKLLRGCWNNEWLDEVCAFTGDPKNHDDIVDATSGAVAAMGDMRQIIFKRTVVDAGSYQTQMPEKRIYEIRRQSDTEIS